jgi:hypothetical protein
MTLVRADRIGAGQYRIELETEPRAVHAGRPVRLRLKVRNQQTGELVRDFAIAHDRRYHLFVISQDLEHYDHVHPEQDADGSWVIDTTLPKPGYYKIYSDFLPAGGTPQVQSLPLVTAGYTGDLASSSARLVPDRALTQTVGGISVTLELAAGGPVAGRPETLTYRMRDARTGAPVTDMEPYLGAWGHTVVMSEDALQFVHAHPVEEVPAATSDVRGGPTLTFKAALPTHGRYRVWTQIKRGGELATAVFTIEVMAAKQRASGTAMPTSGGRGRTP